MHYNNYYIFFIQLVDVAGKGVKGTACNPHKCPNATVIKDPYTVDNTTTNMEFVIVVVSTNGHDKKLICENL